MKYTLKRLPEGTAAYDFAGGFDPAAVSGPWAMLETAEIADNEWAESYPSRYSAYARAGITGDSICVLMYAFETPVLACASGWKEMPCRDSCLEFFVNPFPSCDDRYINIEVNPIGGMCVQTGAGRHDRVRITEAIPGMQVRTCVAGGVWAVSYSIPLAFIEGIYGRKIQPGSVMKGNFYTCSENIHPHFATWNHVTAPQPDFHRPECFGDIIAE